MKDYFVKNRNDLIFTTAFIVFVLTSYFIKFDFGIKVFGNFKVSFLEMISYMPFIFVLIGLFEAWVPREIIERHTGKESGIMGAVWVILLAMLQMGSLYSAFPVAYLLWKKGTSVRNIYIYLGAFTTMKIPMLSFEIGYLGLKFSLLRTILSLPVFIIIAIIMEKMFSKDFKMNNPISGGKK
ncbi:MAG: permease [Brevinematia bacterium]